MMQSTGHLQTEMGVFKSQMIISTL